MKIEKAENLLSNSRYKTKYVIHIRNGKAVSSHGLVLKKFHEVFKFNKNHVLI